MSLFPAAVLLIVAFAILFKCAGLFVEGAVGIARVLRVPTMIVGIVLVGFCTTLPEFVVSVVASIKNHPEMALGNAVGSVICDDALAIPLAALVAPAAICIDRGVLKTAGIFLIAIDILSYLLALNGTFGRLEGGILVLLVAVYYAFVVLSEGKKVWKRGKEKKEKIPFEVPPMQGRAIVLRFALGFVGVVVSSWLVVGSAVSLAKCLGVPEVIIALSLVAFGTSLPEVMTCVTAARKGEGALAAGNIIGADILNILWIVGVSALVRPITVTSKQINFMFPSMLIIVGLMLLFMRMGYSFGKVKGGILLGLYVVYLILTAFFFF